MRYVFICIGGDTLSYNASLLHVGFSCCTDWTKFKSLVVCLKLTFYEWRNLNNYENHESRSWFRFFSTLITCCPSVQSRDVPVSFVCCWSNVGKFWPRFLHSGFRLKSIYCCCGVTFMCQMTLVHDPKHVFVALMWWAKLSQSMVETRIWNIVILISC